MIQYQAVVIRRNKRNSPETSDIDYKNVALLQQFVDSSGKINGRRQTGLDAKKQRAVQKAIKQARSLGLMAFNA